MNRWTARRWTIRDSILALLLAITIGLPLSGVAREPDSPIKPYHDFIYYTSVGDIESALAEFADDAVVVVGALCPVERPCRGKAAIKERYIAPMIQGRTSLPLAERYDGDRIRARSDAAKDRAPLRQFFEFRSGQIASVLAEGVPTLAPTVEARREAAQDD
jgi:hypothetical protein